jgi:hypothetical protein
MNREIPLCEPVAVVDTFVSGVAHVEELSPNLYRGRLLRGEVHRLGRNLGGNEPSHRGRAEEFAGVPWDTRGSHRKLTRSDHLPRGSPAAETRPGFFAPVQRQ